MAPLQHLARWVAIGSVVGSLAGVAAVAFLDSLDWATDTRSTHAWLLWLLPFAGLAMGSLYHFGGGRAGAGSNLILDEIHEPSAWIPRRMAPLIYSATIVTHLFGGSAGREGTAIQMSGSLSDAFVNRVLRLTGTDRRLVLIAAIAGGFGAVFDVPVAGCVFALEVQSSGRVRHDAIVPALTASVVGDAIVGALGVDHTAFPRIAVSLSLGLAVKIVAAGVLFGLAARAFSGAMHRTQHVFARFVGWAPLRPFVGGVAVVALTYVVGNRDYLGLSTPLLASAFGDVARVAAAAFALKLVFTALTLGSGFQGGEVTPLFVVGATLGVTVGRVLHAPLPLLAAIGMVSVFAGATNTPIACTVMGAELFGAGNLVPFAIGCVLAYTFSARQGIYSSQRVDVTKLGRNRGELRRRSRAPG